MKNTLVSVIIPTYKRPESLKIAVTSVINQLYTNWELIVVNDDPTDNIDYLQKKSKKIITINHSINQGGGAARNSGIKQAKGKYIAFLDDDDYWLKNKLQEQVEKIENLNENWIGVYSYYYQTKTFANYQKNNYKLVTSKVEGDLRYDLLSLKPEFKIGAGSSLLLKRTIAVKTGGFDESFVRHQDWDFLLRVMKYGKIALIKKPLWIRIGVNPPSIDKLVKIKEKYLKKHQKLIESYNPIQIRQIYANQWINIPIRFFAAKEYKQGFHYLKKALAYTPFISYKKYVSLVIELCSSWFRN